ncbi:facilitated trehalose transporter Tret1-like [Pararge aegeria]|uniref:facilitated trehalose transporter Tret1-like n=1 Tax=Pararge aegeria TaxID=116150 RepID=UPI0019D10DBB|nr:facilitated trehalose transporter Tret1-like [Pararge aegeria]
MCCFSDVYFRRQCIVHTANCMLSIGTGFMLSFPAVLNPDILSPNGTGIHATPDQASWIAGTNGISGIVGFCFVPYVMQVYGRKFVHIALNLFYVLGFLILALATNIPCLYAARIIQGIPMCAVFITSIMVGEYSHPKRRGYFITIKKSTVAIGSLMCHCLALCWTWKQIAAFAVVPNSLAILFTLTWPESPSFLALTGKYEECDKSHMWLYGDSLKSKRELKELISNQVEVRKHLKLNNNLKTVIKNMLRKDFIKPFIIVSLLTVITDASGRFYMLAYVVQILMEVTKDKSITMYCTIGSDILTITALLISCFAIRCCKRRTLLFISGITCAFLMCSTSLITFLKSHYDIGGSVYWWLTPIVILLNVFIVNVGVVPACFAIMSEIFPLEHKGIGTGATGVVFTILYSIVMKCTPLMMEKTGVESTFGIYALHVIVGLLILYFILNETKDKTLQQIENEIKGRKQPNFNDYYLNGKPLICTE